MACENIPIGLPFKEKETMNSSWPNKIQIKVESNKMVYKYHSQVMCPNIYLTVADNAKQSIRRAS